MDYDAFADLVAEALDSLPEEFLERLDNVQVTVEEWPDRQDLLDAGLSPRDRYSLLGLYHGVPLTDRHSQYMALPDEITIFQKPIEALVGRGRRGDQGTGAAHRRARDSPLLRHRRRPSRGTGQVLTAPVVRRRRRDGAGWPQRESRRASSSKKRRSLGRMRRARWVSSRVSTSSSATSSRVSCSGCRNGSSSSRAAW